jgi:amino-acid N-acetyltransferase
MGDVEAVYGLIEEASHATTVLPRAKESIGKHLRDFVVAEAGGRLVGCGALYVSAVGLAEIRSLVVRDELRGQGIGPRIVTALLAEARRLGIERVFALTDNVAFFRKAGFRPSNKDTLPHKVWNDCVRCSKFLHCTEEAVELSLSAVGEGDAAAGDANPRASGSKQV